MPSCAVRNCKNRTSEKQKKCTDVIYFSFPHNEKIAEQWVKFCGNPDLKISNSTICSLHFEESCFIHDWRDELTYSPKGSPKLKLGAIPTIGICQPLKDTNTNIVCERTITQTMEPLKMPEFCKPRIASSNGVNPPFEKIFVKDPFFINFKDNSGAFLNDIRNQSQNCTLNSDLRTLPPLTENIHPGTVTHNCTCPCRSINHDHDYTKSETKTDNGPVLHNDKGNMYLTINLTEYSKVIDVKRICGVVLVLNDQPTKNSKNTTNTNNTHDVNEPILNSESVSGSDPIDEVRSENKLISINGKRKVRRLVSVKERISFNEHFRINEKGEKEFNCPKCEKIYYSPRLLQRHFKKEHDPSYKYKCTKCTEVYRARNVLQNHIIREHYMKCQFCENKYETVRMYKTHLKEDHKEVHYNMCKPFSCELCDEELKNKTDFLRHMRQHGGIVCGICGERFDSKQEFTAHEETHPNKYFCEICSKGFKERHSLKAHMEVHNDPVFVCNICQKRFKAKGTLRYHILVHQNKQQRLMCDKCPTKFYCLSRLVAHQRSVHDNIRPFQCHECDKKFSTKSSLQLHHRIMHLKLKPFQCEFCGRQFAKKDALVNHRHIHTGTPRKKRLKKVIDPGDRRKRNPGEQRKRNPDINNSPVDCKICGKTLKNMISLKGHLNTHARIRKYKCNFCGLMFLHQTSKIRHEKSHEADPEHKFVCPICWKRTKTREELDVHISQHNNRLQRHRCDTCGETFSRRLLLDNHMLLEHIHPEEINKKKQEINEVFQAVNTLESDS